MGERSPLLHEDWHYVEHLDQPDMTVSDWSRLSVQRKIFYPEFQARAVLNLFESGKDEPTFGYQVNHYRHALQVATMMVRDQRSEEDIVVGLLHDIGFHACPERHGAFAAELLGSYVSEANVWMLRHHQVIGETKAADAPDHNEPMDFSRWENHEHFAWTLEFCQRYDERSMDPDFDAKDIDYFVPLIKEVFAYPGTQPDFS